MLDLPSSFRDHRTSVVIDRRYERLQALVNVEMEDIVDRVDGVHRNQTVSRLAHHASDSTRAAEIDPEVVVFFQNGAELLLKKRGGAGGWGKDESTCFALLFLRRASAPRPSGV